MVAQCPLCPQLRPDRRAATVTLWANFYLTQRSKQHPPFDDVGGVSERVLLGLEMKRPPNCGGLSDI